MTSLPLAGRTILVTGANTGIGRATSEELARRGARLYLACRSEDKTRPVLESIRRQTPGADVSFLPLDLADLASVRQCAERFLRLDQPLHVLLNNAGLAGQRGVTKQGFELTFGVNHLGHFLLTQLLLPSLERAGGARIVNVSSKAHYDCQKLDFAALEQPTRTITGLTEYEVSKLCNVLFTAECARRYRGKNIHNYALHPGVIASDVWRRIPWPLRAVMTRKMGSVTEGSVASLHCATSPAVAEQDGLYYDRDGRQREPSKLAQDPALARELWTRSEAWAARA